MTPYRFKKNAQKYGLIVLSIIFLTPKLIFLFHSGETTTGNLSHYNEQSGKTSTSSSGSTYFVPVIEFNVNNKKYAFEAADWYFGDDIKNIPILYDPIDPANANIKTLTGVFFMRTLCLVLAAVGWMGLTSLFLKD